MRCLKFLFGIVFFLFGVCPWAREVTDTLASPTGDRVIITYDIAENNGLVDLKFTGARKILGPTFKKKSWKLDEIAVLFFDRIGNFNDGMKLSGVNIEAFMIPKDINYSVSEDGYFLLRDKHSISLSMKLVSEEPVELSIPIYLAHYEKKLRYNVFCRCDDNLVIKLSKKKLSNLSNETTVHQVSQTVTTQEELEGANVDEAVAMNLISLINERLSEQDDYPFSDDLQHAHSRLLDMRCQPLDSKLSSRIDEILTAYNSKEKELKDAKSSAEEAKAKADLQRIADMQQRDQARQDSITAAAQQQAEKEKKRNLWLIIGGVILAVLSFIGNQLFQHYRNVKNQRNIMAMQENVIKRAESEAKRRARNMAHSQINRAQGEVKRKARNTINAGVSKIRQKGNKGISI